MHNLIHFEEGMLLFEGRWFAPVEQLLLTMLLLAAMFFDIKSHRIPNRLVFLGAISAVMFHLISPHGIGPLRSAEGLAVGLIALLPLYAMRAMGAGDIKLMAMAGAFLGPASAVGAVVTVLIAGGVLSLAAAMKNRSIQRMLSNMRFMMTHALVGSSTGTTVTLDAIPLTAGKVPYAVAIAAGTIIHLWLVRIGHPLLA